MSTTLREIVSDTVQYTDELTTLVQRLSVLKALCDDSGDQEIMNIYNKVRDKIVYISGSMESIESSNAISQNLVLAIETQLPGVFGDRQLGSFTKEPSSINLGYAMESLSIGKFKLMSGGFGALIALLIKAIDWIIDTIKAYIKSRRNTALIALNVTQHVEEVASFSTTPAPVVLTALRKRSEYIRARSGFDWVESITNQSTGRYKYDNVALNEWWPELLNELMYEFLQLRDAYRILNTDDEIAPNIVGPTGSPAMERFFKAMPQGMNRNGKVATAEQAAMEYRDNPLRAMYSLGERLRYMMATPAGKTDEEFLERALTIGRYTETYTAVDGLAFDALNSVETSTALSELRSKFGELYKAVQKPNPNIQQERMDTYVSFVNLYADKLNCFTQLVSLVAYLDGVSYGAVDALGKLMIAYIDESIKLMA